MVTTDPISPDLRTVLRRLKLSPILETLPERLVLARQQKMTHQDFLLLLLADEAARRDSLATSLRVQRARLDPAMQLELWDATARVTYDHTLWNELVSLRFLERSSHVIIVGPVGVGKTFLAHALGHIACRHGRSVLALRADKMLKTLKHARLDNSYEAELRKLLAPDLLIVDDFALDSMDAVESRDAHEIITERHPLRFDGLHFQSRARRMARHVRRSDACAKRNRSTHRQRLRSRHRRRVVSATTQAERAAPTTDARSAYH